jgi:hypothetical protein
LLDTHDNVHGVFPSSSSTVMLSLPAQLACESRAGVSKDLSASNPV